jgi:hypothetical protein
MFSSQVIRRVAPIIVAVASVVARPAVADPPERVARVSFLSGPVSFRPASADEWTTATLNYPVTIGDHLWIDRGARTELELGSAFVRLAPNTEFSVINLDDRLAQLRITQGVLAVRVRSFDADDAIEIDTPGGAVSLLRPGFYRVDVAEDGASTVTVRSGEAEVTGDRGATDVRSQQSLSLNGPEQGMAAAGRTDEFEDWCLARDRRAEYSVAARYLPADMIGYEDLDQYGGWQQVADYGPVWIPRVSAEWAPYHDGHWVWIEPWGWTWIDDAPWGFAPFHYGRWVRLSAGWGWVPGRIVARPVYAPALVAFVGGSGWQASLRVGSAPTGWFPLGPREPFVPAYRVSETYVQRVNISHVNVTNVDITNVTHVNREVPGAMTTASRDAFVRERPAAPRAVAAPPAAAVSRPVVVRRAPPEAAHAQVRERAVVVPPRAQERQVPPAPQTTPAPVRPAVAPPAPAPPAAAPPPPRSAPPNADAGLAARHAQERADLDARHNAERAQLQARHQSEERAARDPKQRQELQRQHQQEQKAMQDRHKQERDAAQKRQDDERRKKGGG